MTPLRAGEDRNVPMGAMAVAIPPDRLSIRGVGSCIALALTDPVARVGGLAHTVLPRAERRTLPGPAWASSEAPLRLLDLVVGEGARRERVVAKIAGGASMFAGGSTVNVGHENARAVAGALDSLAVPLVSRRVGGRASRNVTLDPATGRFDVEERRVRPRTEYPLPEGAFTRESELATLLLTSLLRPLSQLLGAPASVAATSVYELTRSELAEFLGGFHTALVWSTPRLAWNRREIPFGILLPRVHASRLAREAAVAVGVDRPDEEIVPELLNMMTSSVAGALAAMSGARVVPGPPTTGAGPAHRAIRVADGVFEGGPAFVLHGRAEVEGVIRGADVALLLPCRFTLQEPAGAAPA